MEKNIYSKLAQVRVELQSRNLKKSGFNKFANFKYFELSDFLPTINELCEKEGILTVFSIDGVFARLDVIECDTGAKIEFLTHVIQAQMKGSNPIQELGATHTYLRRFLMLMAFEITDGDVVDALPQQKEEPKHELTDLERIKALSEEQQEKIILHYGIVTINDLSPMEKKEVLEKIGKKKIGG